jgi:sterol desaturase/sphingolipid hydroxylase (fatty acid hydroxylase superfamily)
MSFLNESIITSQVHYYIMIDANFGQTLLWIDANFGQTNFPAASWQPVRISNREVANTMLAEPQCRTTVKQQQQLKLQRVY